MCAIVYKGSKAIIAEVNAVCYNYTACIGKLESCCLKEVMLLSLM